MTNDQEKQEKVIALSGLESSSTLTEAPERVIAVVLPAYNEELTVAETIEAFHRELPEALIVVVNNNSRDRTSEIARTTFSRLGASGIVIEESRQGKGNAVRRAFSDVEADVFVMADADLTYPADQVRQLIEPVMSDRADMVVGDRLSGGDYSHENRRRFHNFGNKLVRWLVNRLFRARLSDIMSGYRVFSKKFVKTYPILVSGFELETDITLHALDKRFRILELPVAYKDRPPGSFSKLSTIKDGARVLFSIAQILRFYRPLLFFGSLAIAFAMAGLLTAIPVFQDWLEHRYIYHLPLAVLAAALELAAMILFSVGIVLDSVTHLSKMQYERHLLDRDRKR